MEAAHQPTIVDALQIGAAEVWHAHPCISATSHAEANDYITSKEKEFGEVWSSTLNELRDRTVNHLYLRYADNSPLDFRAGMATGLYIINQSRFFAVDSLSVVRKPIIKILENSDGLVKYDARRRLFEYAMTGFDIIKPLFDSTDINLPQERKIMPGGRNHAFEMGVGMMLRAAVLSDHSATPKRALV